ARFLGLVGQGLARDHGAILAAAALPQHAYAREVLVVCLDQVHPTAGWQLEITIPSHRQRSFSSRGVRLPPMAIGVQPSIVRSPIGGTILHNWSCPGPAPVLPLRCPGPAPV